MTTPQKTVLMLQPSKRQGQIWQAALMSQKISVIWEASDVDLAEMLDQMHQAGLNPPDLLLMDVGVLSCNPYAFCRWCREKHPDQRIVLTNANQKEISPPERHWATYQGALDLLPGFQRETLLTGVTTALTRVLEILDFQPLNQEPLIQVLFSITSVQSSSRTPQVAPVAPVNRSNGHPRKPVPTQLIPMPESLSASAELAAAKLPAAPSNPLPTAITPEEPVTPEEPPVRRYRGVVY